MPIAGTYNDLWYALMLGCISGIVAGFICYFIYALRTRPGKEILTAIKHEQFYVVYQPVVDTRTLSVTGLKSYCAGVTLRQARFRRMPLSTMPKRNNLSYR
ncbi:rtn protein [Salmonella enterica subsp. enterica]|uniref:Rtn protein n=1 Tax=Salmonella enterica I TaxID=59201 RepID=A0A379VN92_SALET|nr:rtn protein [Salmonella enterica subsp. enterica]